MKLALLLCAALILPAILPFASLAAPARKEGPPPLVTVINVTEENVTPTTEYIGHVEAIQAVDLQARVSGTLEQVNFREGSMVLAGAQLYLIEPAPFQSKVAANRARVARTQAILEQASQRLKRIQSVAAGGIPETDIEAAKAEELQARADLQEAQANLELAEIDLGYTRITAPISGRIGATKLTRGNLCGPNSGTLARIVQLDPIRVLFSISENDLPEIRTAQADAAQPGGGIMNPRLKLPDGSLLDGVGRIDFVDNRVDPATGTIAVRARFDNRDGRLLPGQYVTLVADQSVAQRLPIIPQAAVLEDRDGRYVLLVDAQNRVEQRRIATGPAVGHSWAVTSGLQAGETIIVQGIQKVRPGQTVQTTISTATPQGN